MKGWSKKQTESGHRERGREEERRKLEAEEPRPSDMTSVGTDSDLPSKERQILRESGKRLLKTYCDQED